MTNTIIKLFLLSIVSTSIFGRVVEGGIAANNAHTRRFLMEDSSLTVMYYNNATALEEIFPNSMCGAGGVRRYLRTQDFMHCEALRDFEDYLTAIARGDEGDQEIAAAALEDIMESDYTDCTRQDEGSEGDEECFQDLIDKVANVKLLFGQLNAIDEECEGNTTFIEQNIADAYNSEGVVETLLLEEEGADSVLLVNFTGVDHASYESDCFGNEEPGGLFVKLSYFAVCDEIDAESLKIERSLKLLVLDHPRCYSMTCDVEADSLGLLQRFTIRPTEERNGVDRNSVWLCVGKEETLEDIALLLAFILLTGDASDTPGEGLPQSPFPVASPPSRRPSPRRRTRSPARPTARPENPPSSSPSPLPTKRQKNQRSPSPSPAPTRRRKTRKPVDDIDDTPTEDVATNGTTTLVTGGDRPDETFIDQAMNYYYDNKNIVLGGAIGLAVILLICIGCCCCCRGGGGSTSSKKKSFDNDDDSDDDFNDEGSDDDESYEEN